MLAAGRKGVIKVSGRRPGGTRELTKPHSKSASQMWFAVLAMSSPVSVAYLERIFPLIFGFSPWT